MTRINEFVQKGSVPIVFLGVAGLFVYLNNVQPYYFIDEVFHVPQTLRYCAGNFTEWDSKITTLPGLYLIATLILSPLNLCNISYMRALNLLGTFFNFYLAYSIVKEMSTTSWIQKWNIWMKLVVAYNIMFFPPLFFWHFLYYTDVASTSAILLTLLLHLKKKYTTSAVIGFLSVLIRQTNIVWIGFFTVERTLDLLDYKKHKTVPREHSSSITELKLLWNRIVGEMYRGWISFMKFIINLCIKLLPHVTVCLLFIGFVIWNDGIVVGDKTAHIPTIHIPQFFYFSVFIFSFLWPYMITYWKDYLDFIMKHWFVANSILVLLTLTIHFNTLVHPYVLADNRHYVFYIWNKLMGRYKLFKYLLIPVYSFTLYSMFKAVNHLRLMTQINYFLIVCIVVIPQLLIEPRYFITPYILYRFLIREPKAWQVIAESLTTLTVNFLQFYIFVHKVFYWADQPYPQRITW